MPANAAIYLPYDKVDLCTIFPTAKSNKGLFSAATYFDVPCGAETVRFNLMPPGMIGRHLAGFLGYIESLPDEPDRKRDAQTAVRQSRTVLGLVAESEFADNHAIWQALFQIADAYDGYVFVNDSVLLANGAVIVGPMRNA